jgi:hypothetical protein
MVSRTVCILERWIVLYPNYDETLLSSKNKSFMYHHHHRHHHHHHHHHHHTVRPCIEEDIGDI